MKKTPRYESEVALCAAFIAWVKSQAGQVVYGRPIPAWVPYAETAGWDILLVAPDGTQIGIQAKLRFNLKVIAQSIPAQWDHWRDEGPDFRAVLVPQRDGTAVDICAALGLMLFAPLDDYRGITDFAPGLDMEHSVGWHYWSPHQRCELPEFVPDVAAGSSAPVQLTKWKIAALRIAATLELDGHVTREHFRLFRIDPRRWTGPSGWLVPGSTPGQFVRGAGLDFDTQHPEVYAQVLAELKAKREFRLEPDQAEGKTT